MVEQAKYAQANAEQKLKTANQTVNKSQDLFLYENDFLQIDALVVENTQLKKNVTELKEIINNSRSSLFTQRSTPLTSVLSSTEQQQPPSSIRQIVREKLHKRSSSDLQQSLSSIDMTTKIDNNVVS
jgi:hypothetical protein